MSRLSTLLLICALAAPARAQLDPAIPFEMPASLQPAVGFWVRVYAEWPSTHAVIHDTAHVEVVYRVMDLSHLEPLPGDSTVVRQQKSAARMQAVLDARTEVEDALEALDASRPASSRGLTGAQREAFMAWEHQKKDPERFARAAGRVRSQRGIADRYAEGWRQGGRFVGAIQAELAAGGLPAGLVALAMTESLLNLNARSVSHAVGPWQFLKGTGKEYLVINDLVDERKDPVLATRAAARYLAASKRRLGSWGVAITGYNYGMNGMARAVQQLGTDDIETILRDYKTNAFGFAAKNYYAEFLASLHVVTHADAYFPGLNTEKPWTFDVLSLPSRVKLADVATAAGVPVSQVADLNPALTREALVGTVTLPAGFTVRVPQGRGARTLAALGKAAPAPVVAAATHVVRKGDTLMGVARKHNVTTGELCAANGLDPHTPLLAGTSLSIPAARLHFTPFPDVGNAAAPGTLVASRSMNSTSALPRFAAVFSRRPALPSVAMAVAQGPRSTPQARPMPPPPPPPAATLVSTLPPPPVDNPAVELVGSWTELAPMVSRGLKTGQRVAGGPLLVTELPDEEPEVDVVAGRGDLPVVDVLVGAAWSDGQPHAPVELAPAPPVAPAS